MNQRSDPQRQLRQRLESLEAAGVQFLTRSVKAAPPPTESNLFSEVSEESASIESRRQELTVLAERVRSCTRCSELASTRTQTVFGVGPLDPELCFVAEAPGRNEDLQGEPLVGEAGQLLNRIIAACGMKREDVYLCNVLKCRPPGNRDPKPEECANCREYLETQLALVRPKFLCALGKFASQSLLNSKLAISKLRGRFHDFKGIPVICTFHPAALLRNPGWKRDVWDDMKMLLARMGKPIPGSKGAGRGPNAGEPTA